jgi:hypothetical protein
LAVSISSLGAPSKLKVKPWGNIIGSYFPSPPFAVDHQIEIGEPLDEQILSVWHLRV